MSIIEFSQPQHIPSSQTVPIYEQLGKQIMITPFQFDTMNYICYEAQKQISLKYGLTKTKQIASNDELKLEEINKHYTIETEQDLFNFLRNQVIEIKLDDLILFTNKYKTNNKSNMRKEIEKLQDIKVVVNQFKKDSISSGLKSSRFPLITRIDNYSNNVIKLRLEHELIFGWIFEAIPFSRILIKEQASLSTMYAKHIYALCSDYQKLGKFEIEFEKFKNTLNLKAPNVSKLKGNYLNKAIKEINDKTKFNITTCNGKKVKGINYIQFEFTVSEEEMSLEDELMLKRKEAIALERLEKSKQFQKIENEEAWLKRTIKSISDEDVIKLNELQDAISKLNDYDITPLNDKLRDHFGDWVTINENKLLSYVYAQSNGKTVLTDSPIETLKVLEELKNEG